MEHGLTLDNSNYVLLERVTLNLSLYVSLQQISNLGRLEENVTDRSEKETAH